MATSVEGAGGAVPHASLVALAQLGAALTRPFTTFAQIDTAPLTQDQFEALCTQTCFRQPLERFYARQHDITLSAKQARRLPTTPAGRLAIALLAEPMPQVEQAALLVSGAAMQQQVLQTVHKPEREHLRAVLGPAAFQVAALEAPMLYPSLSRHGNAKRLAALFSQDEDTARCTLVALGMGLLGAAAATASRPLSILALKRLSLDHTAPLAAHFSPHDMQSVMRLLQRRMSPWTAIIG